MIRKEAYQQTPRESEEAEIIIHLFSCESPSNCSESRDSIKIVKYINRTLSTVAHSTITVSGNMSYGWPVVTKFLRLAICVSYPLYYYLRRR